MITDLGDLDVAKASEAGSEIELLHPVTKEPLGQFISITGKESQAYRDWVAESANRERRLVAQAARRGRAADIVPYEATLAEGVSLLVACTTGFRCADTLNEDKSVAKKGGAFLRYRGEEMPFNAANATKFYSDPGMIEFKKQIDFAIGDLGNFIKS